MIETAKDAVVLLTGLTLILAGGLFGLFEWFFGNHAYQEFARNVVLAVISLTLGIPFGLNLNRRWQSRQDSENRKQLLGVLRKVFQDNITYLRRAAELMDCQIMLAPSFPLDVITLEATTQVRYQLITDLSLAEKIDKAHFEILHVNRRFEVLVRMVADQSFTTQANFDEVASILGHLQLFNETSDLAHDVATQMNQEQLGTGISNRQLNIIRAKIETINLAVGLTPKDSEKRKAEGAAVAHCRTAIAAIDKSLGK